MDAMIDQWFDSVKVDVNSMRYKVVREALESIGFQFKTNAEYLEFLKDRITAVGHSGRGEYDLFLDMGSDGRFIGTIYDPPKVDEDRNFSLIIGKFPPTQPIIPPTGTDESRD